jgi:hypothetical protein
MRTGRAPCEGESDVSQKSADTHYNIATQNLMILLRIEFSAVAKYAFSIQQRTEE